MVKKRVIRFFTLLFIFAIVLLLIQVVFLGKVALFEAAYPPQKVLISNTLGNENYGITGFTISQSGPGSFSMLALVTTLLILFMLTVKFVYNQDKKIRREILFGRVDRGLIKLDLP